MSTITATKARENIYKLIESVNMDSEPVLITNTRGKNAVMISEDDWKSIQETLYLYSIPGMVDSILDGVKEPLSECSKFCEDEEW